MRQKNRNTAKLQQTALKNKSCHYPALKYSIPVNFSTFPRGGMPATHRRGQGRGFVAME